MRIRFKIRTLLIVTAIFALLACYYGMTLQEYRSEAAALKQLEKDGWAISHLVKSEINKEDASVIARAARVMNMPFQFVFGSGYNERCTQLHLVAGNSLKNLKALESLKFLKRLSFDDEVGCDNFVDTFLRLKRLETVEFFIDNINVESYKRLAGAGIEVRHYGLKGYQPKKNFLRYGGHSFPIDLNKSRLNVRLVLGDKGPRFNVEINTFDLYPAYQMPSPCLQYTIEQIAPGSIAELIASGELVETKPEDDDGSNFYDGIHHGVTYNSLKLVSHKEERLRIKWGFKTSVDEQFGAVDVELPIKKVAVYVDAKGAVENVREQAVNLFSEHFELAGFQEPVFDFEKNRFIFTAK